MESEKINESIHNIVKIFSLNLVAGNQKNVNQIIKILDAANDYLVSMYADGIDKEPVEIYE